MLDYFLSKIIIHPNKLCFDGIIFLGLLILSSHLSSWKYWRTLAIASNSLGN